MKTSSNLKEKAGANLDLMIVGLILDQEDIEKFFGILSIWGW